MKKLLITLLLASAAGGFYYYKTNQLPWFTIEKIQIDFENRTISGNCIEGPYLGEIIIPIPASFDLSKFQENETIQVQGGPAMTMSLPPQLMTVRKIKSRK